MCKLDEIINYKPLIEIMEMYDGKNLEQIRQIIQQLMTPAVFSRELVSFTIYRIDVTKTVYQNATAQEIVDGWNLLIERSVPMNICTSLFCLPNVLSLLSDNDKNSVSSKNSDIIIDNSLEPLILEILRLCYWIQRCRDIMDATSFESKFAEIYDALKIDKELEFRNKVGSEIFSAGSQMRNKSESNESRIDPLRSVVSKTNIPDFRSRISSILPECICAVLLSELGLKCRFIPQAAEKRSDLYVNEHRVEVKTFIDKLKESRHVEESLEKEIIETMKREKAVGDINRALDQGAEIVILFLTFSSVALGLAGYTYKTNMSLSIQKSTENAFSLLNNLNSLPVIVVTTLIDAVSCKYRIFSFVIRYPLQNMSQGTRKCDDREIRSDDIIFD